MSGANSLTKAVWSRKERLARNRWKGEAWDTAGLWTPANLQACTKMSNLWVKTAQEDDWSSKVSFTPSSVQEGGVTTPGPFTYLHLAGSSCITPSGNTFQCVVLDYLMVDSALASHSQHHSLQLLTSWSPEIIFCLHLRVCSSPANPKMDVVEVSVYCWQGGCTFNPEPPSRSTTLYQRGGGGWC